MPEPKIVAVDRSNCLEYLESYSEVYLRGEIPGEEDHPNWDDDRNRFIIRVGEQTAGSFQLIPYDLTRDAATIRTAGVGAVAVRPGFRRSGIGTKVMVLAQEVMRELGYPLSYLYAFRDSYYRRMGYETCGLRWELSVPEDRLPRLQSELPVRQISFEELPILDSCYQQFARTVNGANVRTSDHWEKRMGEKPPMIYAIGDPVEAYAWTTMAGGFWDDLILHEVVWSTKAGYEGFLNFARGLAINRSRVIWSEPTDGPYLTRFYDQGVQVKLHRQTMFRATDVAALFESLKPTTRGEFKIRIIDRWMESNSQAFHVEFESGSCRAIKCDRADLEIEIGHFAQGFMGQPDFAQLANHGLLKVQNPAALSDLRSLLPAQVVYCTEFF